MYFISLFNMGSRSGNLPNSPLQAMLVALRFTPRYVLQNFKWIFSVGDWSHFLKSWLIKAPHISELYKRIGEIMLSNILIANFGESLLISSFLLVELIARWAFSASCLAAKVNFPLGVSLVLGNCTHVSFGRVLFSKIEIWDGLFIWWSLKDHDLGFFQVNLHHPLFTPAT
jgi:hypothetical protein